MNKKSKKFLVLKTNVFLAVFLIFGFFNYFVSFSTIENLQNESEIISQNNDFKTNEILVNDDSYFVDEQGYQKNDHPINVYTYNTNGNKKVMSFNKITGETQEERESKGAKYFNDNNEISDGNETDYSPIATIYFSPNIDYVDNISIYFEIKDYYRETGNWGTDYQKSEENVEKITLSNPSTFDEYGISDQNFSSYEDYVYYDEFSGSEHKYEWFPFRFTYQNNPISESDSITIYEKNPANLSDDANNVGGGHGYIDEGYTGAKGNNDVFLDNSLKISCNLHYDTPLFSEFEFKKDEFVADFIKSILSLNEISKFYKSDDTSGGDNIVVTNQGENGVDFDYDKIYYSFDGISYEDILKDFLTQSLTIGNFISDYFYYSLDSNYANRELRSSDFILKYGFNSDTSTYKESVVLDSDYSNDFIGKSTPIDSSQLRLNICLNPNSLSDIYTEDVYGEYGFDYLNDFDEDVSINLPFYNWTFEEISNSNDHKTLFDEDTSFLIPEVELESKLLDKEYDINVYTNSNIRFTINNDPNIASISHNMTNVNPSSANSFKIETQFDEEGEEATKQQRETVTISYKNKVSNLDFEEPVNQKININFYYDADSPINNSELTAEENIGENSKSINSEVMMITNDELNLTQEKPNQYELVDLFKAQNDLRFTLSNDQMNFITNLDDGYSYSELDGNEDSVYVQNIVKYSAINNEGNYSIASEDYSYLLYGNEIIFSDPGLYKWNIRTKSKREYSYWILISDSFVDFDYEHDDGIESNNTFPIEWILLKDVGLIEYNDELESYSFKNNGHTFYVKNFIETAIGNQLVRKGEKKGWTKSELSEEPSYSIRKLNESWEQLKDFNNLIIDIDKVSESTSNLFEKDKNKFKDMKGMIENELISQLVNENGLSFEDFEIFFYDENNELIPDGKILDTKDTIIVKIESTKYGKGINSYEFEFSPSMIKSIPLWIQTTIVLVLLVTILFIVLIVISIINRRKILKIKG